MKKMDFYLNANLKQIIKNHNEWKKLINTKNIETLEDYRKEFSPFKANTSLEYATITINSMIKNGNIIINEEDKHRYIYKLLSHFKGLIK